MLLMFALFGVMFWAIWSDLITVLAYLDSITLWHYNGAEAGAAVVKRHHGQSVVCDYRLMVAGR
ncbi:hypothetical protein ACVXHA_02010 [Escherichia coli]